MRFLVISTKPRFDIETTVVRAGHERVIAQRLHDLLAVRFSFHIDEVDDDNAPQFRIRSWCAISRTASRFVLKIVSRNLSYDVFSGVDVDQTSASAYRLRCNSGLEPDLR